MKIVLVRSYVICLMFYLAVQSAIFARTDISSEERLKIEQAGASGAIEKIPESLSRADSLLEKVAHYEYGQNREPLVNLSDLVRQAGNSKVSLLELEMRFVKFLKSNATLAGKEFVCRQLSLIGSDVSIPVLSAMLSDSATGNMARYALERIPGPAANKALRQGLKTSSGKELIGIINTLGQRCDQEAVPALGQMITDKDESVALASIAALGTISGSQAASVLAGQLKKSRGVLREAITSSYLQCAEGLATMGDKPGALAIYRQLNAPEETSLTRIAALHGLAVLASPDSTAELWKAMKSTSPEVQAVAIHLLGGIPGPGVTDQLVAAYPGLNTMAQIQLLACLSERGDSRALPHLTDTVRNSDAVEVRVEALKGIGFLGDASSAKLLAETAATRDGPERDAARESLYRLRGKEVDQSILSDLQSSSTQVKLELIRATGERSIGSAVNPLLVTARDSNAELRRESLRALRELAGPPQVPEIIDLLSSAKTDQERNEAERTLSAAIRKAEKTSVEDVLAAYPKLQEATVQGSLLRVLGSVGNSEGLPLLREQLKNSNPDLRRAAILAITDWPSDAPGEDLLAIAKGDANAAHQVLALRGYIRLISIPGSRSAQETVKLLEEALNNARRPDEKKAVLAVLPQFACDDALRLAEASSKDSALAKEAQLAVTKIKDSLGYRR